MVRTSYCDKTGLKRGAWSPEEDRKLSAYIKKYDHWNWSEIPRFAGLSRCGNSCRLRWKNYLRPNIRRGNYTQEEEEIIINLHETLGNRWSAIAAKLPGRTDNEVKNHWHTHLKKCMQRSSTPREEAILQPVTEVSECESESADLVDTFLDNALRPFILESSSVVSVSLESAILEKSASPADTNSETKQKVGNIIPDTTNEISGNLWAEFFQMPDSNFVEENFTSSLVDPELVFPPPSLHDWTDPNQVIDDAKLSFEEDFIAASMLDQDTVIPTSPLYSLSDEPIQEADSGSNFFDDNFIHYMGDQDFIFLPAPLCSWVESFQVAESNFSAENFTSNQLANPENVFESSSTNSFDNGEEVYFNHLLLGGEEVPILF